MKNIILVIYFGLSGIAAMAATVSPQDAQTVAVNHFKLLKEVKGVNVTATLTYTHKETDGIVDFYAFNTEPKGFVIVSAQDIAEPILAYSTDSYFVPDIDNRTGVSDWTEDRASLISNAVRQNLQADERIKQLWTAYRNGMVIPETRSTAVQPLVGTAWDQNNNVQYLGFQTSGTIYNNLCPMNTNDNDLCVTGCVATAMAQIINKWQFPAQGYGTAVDTDSQWGILTQNLSNDVYNYAIMPPSLFPAGYGDLSSSNEAINAVALLIYDCGVAVNMNYNDNKNKGSGASVYGTPRSAEQALVQNFHYNPCTIKYISDAAGSASTLENELIAGRPFLFSGSEVPGPGGHCWCGVGVDGNDKFYMNWGWGGSNNGYFSIANNISGVNNGTTFGSFGALTGIEPLYNNVTISSYEQPPPFVYDTIRFYNVNIVGYGRDAGDTVEAVSTVYITAPFKAQLTGPGAFIAKIGASTCIDSASQGIPVTNSATDIRQLQIADNKDGIQIIPNPFNSSFEVSIIMPQDEKASIIIYNTLGERVKEISARQLTSGSNKIAVDLNAFASGMYLAEIKTGDNTVVKKIVKN